MVEINTAKRAINTIIQIIYFNLFPGIIVNNILFTNNINFAVGNLQASKTTEVKIIDVLGKIILQKNYTNKTELTESLDMSEFNSGIYFINVSNNNMNSFYRIIKN